MQTCRSGRAVPGDRPYYHAGAGHRRTQTEPDDAGLLDETHLAIIAGEPKGQALACGERGAMVSTCPRRLGNHVGSGAPW